jgi:quercetin dioxygenase-like cupin family protein
MADPFARGPEEGTNVWFLGCLMTLKATAEHTGGEFGLIEQLAPAGFATPLHVHHEEDEAFYVLSGDVTYYSGDKVFRAGPGTLVFMPREVPHGFRVSQSGEARMLQLTTPAGLEPMFQEAGESAASATLPPPGEPDIPRLLALAERYRFEILGHLPE